MKWITKRMEIITPEGVQITIIYTFREKNGEVLVTAAPNGWVKIHEEKISSEEYEP